MINSKRYNVLDLIRGIALIGMIIVHTLMDMVHEFNYNIEWYVKIEDIFYDYGGSIFIMLSGFCWMLSKNHLKRGIMMIMFSCVISIATILIMPENTILFGIICLMGSASIIMIPIQRILKYVNKYAGFIVSVCLFIITKWSHLGYIGIGNIVFIKYPKGWYFNLFTSYLGFPDAGFVSADYFPVIPWFFIYVSGYFLYEIFKKNKWFAYLEPSTFKPVEYVGRHSLIIYLAHQPVIYAVLSLMRVIKMGMH